MSRLTDFTEQGINSNNVIMTTLVKFGGAFGTRGGSAEVSSSRDGKRPKKQGSKEKKKPSSELKKRGHPSTPSNSDDSEKPQTKQWPNTERNTDLDHTKVHAKERGSRKCRKSKTIQTEVKEEKEVPLIVAEDSTKGSSLTLESLRWEGVLDDPAAEVERLENYKANRRQRYMEFRKTLLQNAPEGRASDLNVNILGRICNITKHS